jgi:hypothetical protein
VRGNRQRNLEIPGIDHCHIAFRKVEIVLIKSSREEKLELYKISKSRDRIKQEFPGRKTGTV